jgi:CO/xanthine dehydrogenase Mo-binding subunit
MNEGKFTLVGRSVKKVDGYGFVTGKAKFTGDLKFPGMLYGYARRANVAAGRIKKINYSAALAIPGVVTILLAKDIPGPNIIGILPPFDQPLLASKEVRYEGESIALVIAKTKAVAKSAAAKIVIEIESWDPILSVDEALEEGARKIHPQGNIIFSKKLIKGDIKKGFKEAEVIVENTYHTGFQEHAYLEPEAVCAVPMANGRITIYASCQSPFHLRTHISANLNVPTSRVEVIQAYTGGSFGGKDDVAAEIGSLASIAAVKLGKPVMIAHEREESIIGSNLRHASRIHYKTGAKKDGTIVAREIDILLDGGAYASESPFVVMKALIHSAGPYNIPHVFVKSTAVYTNKTYSGAMRGFGVPQVTFASESQIDELAAVLKIDPLELRYKNGLRPGDATATGQVFNQSVGLIETINKIKEKKKHSHSIDKLNNSRWLYGSGFSCMLQGISNGAEGIDVVGASVQMSQDGSVLIGVGLTDMGQGSRTVFAQIAAEVLGITIDKVTVKQVDTDSVHDSGPTVASRGTTVGGMAVFKAAQEVKKSLVKMASLMFKSEEDQIILKDNFVFLKNNNLAKIPTKEVATAAYWTGFPLMNLAFSKAPEANYNHETHQGNIYIAYNFGTHMMNIRVDRYTGKVEVLQHIAAHDVGKVINLLGTEGQVEGGSLFGFGLAHMEKIIFQEGKIINANFADYAVPTVKDRIPTETILIEDYNPTGPFGAKGVGEPPVAGAAAAFANAVADATGVRFRKLPITREDILTAITN